MVLPHEIKTLVIKPNIIFSELKHSVVCRTNFLLTPPKLSTSTALPVVLSYNASTSVSIEIATLQ